MNSPESLATASAPRIVDRYALFDCIASGGMASVHIGRLRGPVGFSRTVAIKRLHERLANSPEFVVMFLDEARLAARIRHPNVVTTLDVVTGGSEVLLVMEYVSGASLARLLGLARHSAPASPAPLAVVVDVMIGVLNGLHAAHEATNEQGERLCVVHQDVSPQNILVDSDGIARVLDFGIAKAAGCLHATRDDEVVGKIRYLSPESITQREITRASDIYSASVVLWEALTGRRLFDGADDTQILEAILAGNIKPPSSFRREVPRRLDAIVMRGLRYNPDERFRSAAEMSRELETAVPPVTRSAVAKWVMARAGDEIRARERYIARVERQHGSHSPVVSTSDVVDLLDVCEDDTVADDPWASTSPSVSRVVSQNRDANPQSVPKRLRWLIGWVALSALCVVGLGLWAASRERGTRGGGLHASAVPTSIGQVQRALRALQLGLPNFPPTITHTDPRTLASANSDAIPLSHGQPKEPPANRVVRKSAPRALKPAKPLERIYRRD